MLSDAQFRELKHQLEQLIDIEKDSLRFYLLGNNYENKVMHVGAKATYLADATLLI